MDQDDGLARAIGIGRARLAGTRRTPANLRLCPSRDQTPRARDGSRVGPAAKPGFSSCSGSAMPTASF
jgi:hypothetical protein